MNYHLDKNGKEIHGGNILVHNDGSFYEPFGTGLRFPGDGVYMPVFKISKDRDLISGCGIGGTSVTFVNTKEVSIYDPWGKFFENIEIAFMGLISKLGLTVKEYRERGK